jgi:hypothetical protein
MLNASQFTRAAVIAATVCSLATSSATARPADQSARPKAPVTTVAKWTQPRVEGTGVRPAGHPVASAAPAVPLTRATRESDGADWLLISIVASTMLALLAIVAVVRPLRHRADSLRARQV